MTTTAIAFLGFVALYLVLTGLIIGLRSLSVAKGEKKANEFNPDGSDVSKFLQRITRAHANCYESFVWFGGVLLYALATNNTDLTDPLAALFLLNRIAQAAVHLISTSQMAVQIRFFLFLSQMVIAVYWVLLFMGWI